MVLQLHGVANDISSLKLSINNVDLTRVSDCKFLVITLDESLTWKRHLSRINQKVSNALFTIKQLKFTLPTDSLRTLYYALIHPHLTYGIIAWGNAKSSLFRKTEIIQKRAIRIIHNKKINSHTDPLFKGSRILKLHDIYQLEVMLFMHDYINDRLPVSFQHIYSLRSDTEGAYNTRQSNTFILPRTKSRFVDRLPLYQFPTMWNRSVQHIKVDVSRNCFERLIKNQCITSYPTVVPDYMKQLTFA